MSRLAGKIARQRGFNLVSLMLATVLGMLLTAAMVKVYLDSKAGAVFHEALSAANENGRFAIDDMRRLLVMAGRDVSLTTDVFGAYNTTTGVRDGTPATHSSAVVEVRYEQGLTCNGGDISGEANPSVRFFAERSDTTGERELYCRTGNGNKQPLVTGIEYMEALYGIDTDSDGYANRYLSAAATETADAWDHVIALRIALVASSGELSAYVRDEHANRTFEVGAATYTSDASRKPLRAMGTTLSLRNLNAVTRQP